MIEILTRVPTAAEIERDLMIALILDHEPAGVRRTPFFLTPIFVFPVTGQNSHPRVVDVKELSVRRQLNQMSVDGENRVRHRLASFKLDGLRKRHAATLLHSRLTIKGHSARIFVERDKTLFFLLITGLPKGHEKPLIL